MLGIKPDSWVATKERLKFTVVAVDLRGKPVAGVRVRTDAFKRDYYSHRRRLIGGFYAYEHGYDTTRVGELCDGATDAHGLLICEMPPPATGQSHPARAGRRCRRPRRASPAPMRGSRPSDDQWFAASDNDRIDLLPEKKRYEPGDVARFQVRTPFKDATALVTVEREGVLDAFVTTVRRNDPMLDVPIKGNYAPNVFVSAFLVRGRIGDVAPTALVDLGKPSFKMGLAEIARRLGRARARGQGDAGAAPCTRCASKASVDDRRAASRRQRAAQGQRGRAGRGGRRPARAPAEQFVETAGRDDGAPRRGSGDRRPRRCR